MKVTTELWIQYVNRYHTRTNCGLVYYLIFRHYFAGINFPDDLGNERRK
jgi:hypothetical protein